MTNDQIIEMANLSGCTRSSITNLIAFARLIEREAREECAALIEDRLLVAFGKGAADYNEGVNNSAAAIREGK